MNQLDLTSPVGQWVAENPGLMRIFEELGIDYCCGGRNSLHEACRLRQLDPVHVLGRLRQSIAGTNLSAGVAEDAAAMSLTELCDHIEQTHHTYLKRELPRLEQLIAKVVGAHGDRHAELLVIQEVFSELRSELEPHMMKEEQILFPAIRYVDRDGRIPHLPFGRFANPIHMMESEHDHAGLLLSRLQEVSHTYRSPEGACDSYRSMLAGLKQLEEDMHQHIHKENNILFPRAMELEAQTSSGPLSSTARYE